MMSEVCSGCFKAWGSMLPVIVLIRNIEGMSALNEEKPH